MVRALLRSYGPFPRWSQAERIRTTSSCVYGSFGFALTFGGFTSLAGFESIHFRLTQKPKKFRKMASSLVHVIAEIGRFVRKRSTVSISTSSSLVIPSDLAIRRKLSSALRWLRFVPWPTSSFDD